MSEYLANSVSSREGRKYLYLIFKPSIFGFKEAPSLAATEPRKKGVRSLPSVVVYTYAVGR